MKFLNVTNHKLTDEQKRDAVAGYGVTEFEELTPGNRAIFGQVPADPDLDLCTYASPVLGQIKGADIAMIQGEHTITYLLVSQARENGVTPVAAVSVREVVEEGGVKTSIFRHKGFRVYV